MTRPLLIGACPPSWVPPFSHSPLYPHPPGCSGHRLMRWSGLDVFSYLEKFDRMNLVPDPEYSHKWNREIATLCAINLLRGGLLRNRRTVLLGRQVHVAFAAVLPHWPRDIKKVELLKWHPLPKPFAGSSDLAGEVILMPHPSGRSRATQQVEVLEKAKMRLRECYQ